jgi:hypothetical protein
MKPAILLGQLGPVRVADHADGIRLSVDDGNAERLLTPSEWPPEALTAPGGSDVAYDLAVLAEADSLVLSGESVLIPFAEVLALLETQRPVACRWASPSPFLLTIDRDGDPGVRGFRYVTGWYLGHDQIPLVRSGVHVRWPSRNKVFRLDATTAAIVQAMDAHNSLPEADRTRTATWSAFQTIREGAERLGVELDDALRSNTVVIPTAVGLELVSHADGTMSFAPRVPELSGAEFRTAFFNNADVPEVYSLSRPDGSRVRVILQDKHREVLRRMKRVTRRPPDEAKRFEKNPASIFDGVMGDVELEYGDRVAGVGTIEFAPAPMDPLQGGIVSRIAPERQQASDDAGSLTPTSGESQVIHATTTDGRSIDLPVGTPSELAELRTKVASALAAGQQEIALDDERLSVNETLLAEIDKKAGTEPAIDKAYLLIYENDQVLDAADPEVIRAAKAQGDEIPFRLTTALEPDVRLKPHQAQGVRWLNRCSSIRRRTGVLLADDMGLGKTLQILTWLAGLIESGRTNDGDTTGRDGPFRPILIVAPLMLVDAGTWTNEMEERFRSFGAVFRPWLILHGSTINHVMSDSEGRDMLGKPRLDPAKLMRHRVVVTTYETVVNYQHSLAQLVDGRPIWSVVVTDEAQRYKVMRTKISHAIKALSPPFQVAATGTPVENRLLDLWNIMDTVQPGLLGTARDFSQRFEARLPRADASVDGVLDELRQELLFGQPNAFLLRRGKEQLIDLPPKSEKIIECAMNEEEIGHERRLTGALGQRAGKLTLQVLQELVARSQHPWFSGGALELSQTRELVRASTKLTNLLKLLGDIRSANEKVLIFARHVAIQQMLAAVVSREFGVDVSIINGETGRKGSPGSTGAHRRRLLSRFESQRGFGVIVLSPFVAGVGLTITAANHVIHYGRWWNPAVESQATDRAYRIGQTKPVTVYYLIATAPRSVLPHGTFDEALHGVITRRRALARDFLHPERAEGEFAAEIVQTLADGAVDVAVESSRTTDYAAWVAALSRRDGWTAVLFAGDGHAGAVAAMVRGTQGRLVVAPGTQPDDAIAAWSVLLPELSWQTADRPGSHEEVPESQVLNERSREHKHPASGIQVLRSAMR